MQIAQFINQPGDKYTFENTIQKYQEKAGDPRPEEIHTELLFSDRAMFSSSGRGGLFAGYGLWPGIGTRFIKFDDIEPDKWRFYPLLISATDEAGIRHDCESMKPKPYDWLGIIGQPVPGNIQLSWADYCSEVGNEKICNQMPQVERKPKIRPGQIIDWYIKQGLIDTRFSDIEIVS